MVLFRHMLSCRRKKRRVERIQGGREKKTLALQLAKENIAVSGNVHK